MLIDAMNTLEAETQNKSMKMTKKKFIAKVLERGKTTYSSVGAIYRLHNSWKKTGKIMERGRPSTAVLDAVKGIIKQGLNDCSIDVSTFKLKHLKRAVSRIHPEHRPSIASQPRQ